MVNGWPSPGVGFAFVYAWVFVNVGWSVFNLLPVWPMDGGHVVRYALASRRRAPSRSQQISLTISMVTAGLLIFLAVGRRQPYIAIFMAFMLYSNYVEYQRIDRPRGPSNSFYGY